MDEKTARRAAQIAASLSTFLSDYRAALLPPPAAAATAAAKTQKKPAGRRTGGNAAAASQPKKAAKGTTKGSPGKGRRGPQQDPKADAWAALFTDIAERLKAKRCALEDFTRAIDLLPAGQQQLLARVTTSPPATELPTKVIASNEALAAAWVTLRAAAAAAALRTPVVPEAGKAAAGEWCGRGIAVREARDAGYRLGQLLRGGYTARELVESAGGNSLHELRAGGVSLGELLDARDAGLGPLAGLDGVACARLLRAAGYAPCTDDRISAWELRLAGVVADGTGAWGSGRGPSAVVRSLTPTREAAPCGVMVAAAGTAQVPRVAAPAADTGSSSVGVALAAGSSAAVGAAAVLSDAAALDFFRGGCRGVMGMRPAHDTNRLLLGTGQQGAAARATSAAASAFGPVGGAPGSPGAASGALVTPKGRRVPAAGNAPPGYPGAATTSSGAPAWGAPAPPPGNAWGAPPPPADDADGKKHGAPPMMGGMPPPMLPPMMPMRPMGIDNPEAQAMAADMAFATTKMRNAFVRKVFGIVTLQLMVTVGVAAACLFVPEVKKTVRAYPGMYYAAWGVAFAVMMVIACFEKARRTFPINVILLAAFTLAEAFLVGMISAFHNINAVMLAFIVTCAAVAALTLFAINTKIDATRWGSMLLVVTIVVLVLSLIGIFWRQRILYLAISGLAAVLFSAYLIYDIQMVMGGRRAEYGPDDYVFAALSIYLDVVNLFMAILSIIGLTSNN